MSATDHSDNLDRLLRKRTGCRKQKTKECLSGSEKSNGGGVNGENCRRNHGVWRCR